jgi:Endoribonuclease L-PSP
MVLSTLTVAMIHQFRRQRDHLHLTAHDIGVSEHLGYYSDAVEVAPNVRWLVTAGTPGFAPDGTLPADFAAQANNAWDNVKRLLEDAGFALSDLVKVPDDRPPDPDRDRSLGGQAHRRQQLGRPDSSVLD